MTSFFTLRHTAVEQVGFIEYGNFDGFGVVAHGYGDDSRVKTNDDERYQDGCEQK